MSYLNSPRLTFSGQFQADPSTVNNDPNHFNNDTFQPIFQEPGDGSTNGWWNPEGTGSWRLIGCTVTSVTYKDGTTATDPKDDAVIGMSLMDAGGRAPAKIVDLDPQQQSVSMIWGLTVRLMNGDTCLIKGDFEPIAFNDIWWARGPNPNPSGPTSPVIVPASAAYQSVIENIEWGNLSTVKSRYLEELGQEKIERLSIKFNVDRFDINSSSPHFTIGRIVGAIAQSKPDEPKHFVVGRQFIPPLAQSGGVYLPTATNIYMGCAVIDEANSQVVIDLGNSLTTGADGGISETRDLTLAALKNGNYESLAAIDYTATDWYQTFGGIATVTLTADQLSDAQNYPLAITDGTNPLMDELADYVRADQFVFRMDPGDDAVIDLYASRLGTFTPGKVITCESQNSLMNIFGQGNGVPPTSTPDVLSFSKTTITGAGGKATLTVNASDPHNPREFVDGQVYGLWCYLADQPTVEFDIDYSDPANPVITPATLTGIDPYNFISILVWDGVPQKTIDNPTWDDIQPVMQQYANLYPLMSKSIFNLADQSVVGANAEILRFVFGKEKADPNYMPATRDLSGGKQRMILNYLDNVLGTKEPRESVTTRKPLPL